MIKILLTTKFHIPPVPSRAIRREHLITLLNQSTQKKLTLISAPAGFGKTTLASMWARQASMPVAWLSLDKDDNDFARFLTYVVAAFQRVEPSLGIDALKLLQLPQPSAHEIILTRLINELATLDHSISLILDDYHLIETKRIHEAVSYLIDHLPMQIQMLLVTRADPPIALPRLRARGQMNELRQGELRFGVEETAAFLNDLMGLNLSAEDIAALEARTEGWIAGLQMVALSLQGLNTRAESYSAFISAFTGSHRYILDYLVEEVFDRQPEIIQDFLLKTSILERLSGPLCDSILAVKDTDTFQKRDKPALDQSPLIQSQAILEQLEAANLFILPMDDERKWYRYHRLFSDLLRKRLVQTSPDLVLMLHRCASTWYEQAGLMNAAIDHALAAHDFERAANMIEQHMEAVLMRSEIMAFLKWVEILPNDIVRKRPKLNFYYGWALLMSGQSLEDIEQHLGVQEDIEISSIMKGRMAVLRAYVRLFQADMQRASALCNQAMEYLPESDQFLRSIVAWIQSMARIFDAPLRDGDQALDELAKLGLEFGNPMITVTAYCYRAKLEMRQGRLHQARHILEHALSIATDSQGKRLPIASELLIVMGELKREWNELEAAAADLSESIELSCQWSELAGFDAYIPLIRVKLAMGDVKGARQTLDTARRIASISKFTEIDDLVADIQQANFAISQGNFEAARLWAINRGLVNRASFSPYPYQYQMEEQDQVNAHLRKYEYLVLAHLLLALQQYAQALDLLEHLFTEARQLSRIDLIIEILILKALVYQGEGQTHQALENLQEALSLAEPGGYMRKFLDEGEPMADLLRQASARGMQHTYVARLLTAFNKQIPAGIKTAPAYPHAQPLPEPLSERELEVLRLMATGKSNPEIAEQLVIAVSTVRSHCKSIYGKLNVHRRWDAVQSARELGLI